MNTVTRRALALAFATSGLFAALGNAWAQQAPRVKLTTTMGEVLIEVYPDKAPRTAENFLQYVRDKHYDGTAFHRVMDGFMIQGGGFTPEMQQKTTRAAIAHEGREAFAKGLKNQPGMLAMARTSDPDSASAQFFINLKDNAFLDPSAQSPGYTVFGKVVSGMEVVEKIKQVPTGSRGMHQNVPVTPVVITAATLVK